VVAFRFLGLKKAPVEVVRALEDSSRDVRRWAALVLGEIGDPKSVEPLMATAADVKAERGLRADAIYALGRMRAKPAADLIEKLLPDPAFSAQAAVALYRITGKKVKEFPPGYNTD
jgi:HEAT repeat protein